jgi:hypothetical protein
MIWKRARIAIRQNPQIVQDGDHLEQRGIRLQPPVGIHLELDVISRSLRLEVWLKPLLVPIYHWVDSEGYTIDDIPF